MTVAAFTAGALTAWRKLEEVAMSGERVECLCEELKAEEGRLRNDLAEARKRVKTLEAEVRRVKSCIAVLNGKTRSSKKRARCRDTVQDPSARSVRDIATEVLRRAGSLPEDRLEEEIAARLGAECPKREELATVLKKALEDSRFSPSVTGWKLAEHTVKPRARENVLVVG
jgi:hypothetical protein